MGRAHSPLPCPLYLSVTPPPFWSSCVKGFPPYLDSRFLQELPNPLFAPENHIHPSVKGPSTAALGPQHTTPPQCHLSCPCLWDHQLTPLCR